MAAAKKSKIAKKQRRKDERDLQALRDIADDVIESDFVPYACLYDPSTIMTKDGELLQTIKITGHGFDPSSANDLRATIRRSIVQSIPDASYGIWVHTLRRQQPPAPRAHFPDSFSGQLDEAWTANLPSSSSFSNELYVTIAKAAKPVKLRDIKGFIQSLIPSRTVTAQTEELEEMHQELGRATRNMLTMLAPYGARLLTLVERKGIYYSEQLEFLEKLINLEQRPMEVPVRDLSHVLTSGEITFGYNAMEVRTAEGHRRFAAMLTPKEYKESTLGGIDKFLEIPCELIISQCFGFTGVDEAQNAYEKQAKLLAVSGDKELAKWMEIERLRNVDATYGQQQTTMFLIAPSVKQLEANVKLVQRAMGRLGMVVFREDLRLEECYWAQLPGNFTFVSRKHAVNTEHLAGFASLQSAPMGLAAGSAWGPPVTQFTTLQDTPYYFNFHRGQSAHTVIIGKPGSGRTSLTHFLVAQARKHPVHVWYVDQHGRGRAFIEAMGGTYQKIGTGIVKLNPFQIEPTPSNRQFLTLWLSTLIDPYGSKLNRSSFAFFQTMIEQLMQLPKAQRRLSSLIPMAQEADPFLAATLKQFCAGGKYGELFDMPEDNLTFGALQGWDISDWMRDPATAVPLGAYLLHRLSGALQGKPTLIVLDEGFSLLDNPLFAARAGDWCDHLSSNNAACILTTNDPESSGARTVTPVITQKAATVFALPDSHPNAEYGMGFGFSAEEMSTLAYLKPLSHQVLQKRGAEAVIIKLDFSHFSDEMRRTLAGKIRNAQVSPADQLAQLMGIGAPAA